MAIEIKKSKVGSLHTALGIPQGEKIPASKLKVKSTDSPALKKKKVFAQNARSWNHEEGGWHLPKYAETSIATASDLVSPKVQLSDAAKEMSNNPLVTSAYTPATLQTPEQSAVGTIDPAQKKTDAFGDYQEQLRKELLRVPKQYVGVSAGNPYLDKGLGFLNESINLGMNVGRNADEQVSYGVAPSYGSPTPTKVKSTNGFSIIPKQGLPKSADGGFNQNFVDTKAADGSANQSESNLRRYLSGNYAQGDKANTPEALQQSSDNLNVIGSAVAAGQAGLNMGKGVLDMVGTARQNAIEQNREQQMFAQSAYAKTLDDSGNVMGDTIRGRNALYADGGIQSLEVPRLLANSEVEGGETLWTPDGEAGRIEGASHANGGIPVNMEEGTRVFSEKLKDPDTKKSWGKIAAKYSTDKLIPAIEKEEDPLRKSSMQLEAYLKNKKLEETFAKQEQLKLGGFYGDDIMMRSQENHLEKELGGVHKFAPGGVSLDDTPIVEEPVANDTLTNQLNIYNKAKEQEQGYIVQPSYLPTDTASAKERVLNAFKNLGKSNEEISELSKKDVNELYPLIRNDISKKYPKVSEHYMKNVSSANQQGIKYLVDNNLLNDEQKGALISEGVLGKDGTVKGGSYNASGASTASLINGFVRNLPKEKQDEYYKTNYFDDKGYYEFPDIMQQSITPEEQQTFGDFQTNKQGLYRVPFLINSNDAVIEDKKLATDNTADKVAAATGPANTANKIVAKQTVNPEVSVNGWIPDTYGRTPLNYFNTEAQTINPRHLNVQDDINQIDRSTRTVESNLGDRSTGSIANALQAQINAMNAKNQVFSRKNQYDKEADQRAQEFNAGQRAETNERNRGSWFSMLENPIRTREEAITRQKMTDSRAAQERGEKYQKDLTTLKDIATRQGVLSTPEMLKLYASLSPEQRKSILGSKGGLDLTKLFG